MPIKSQIIAICGGSGSGKSTLAHKFVGAAIVSTDSFYKNIEDLEIFVNGKADFDHPSAVDLDSCAKACQQLAQGQDVIVPVYDIKTCKTVGSQIIPASPKKIVIVEGIFAFHCPLSDIATLKIFIDTPIDQRMARRIRRDVDRGRSTLETIAYSLNVEEAYSRYVEPMREKADLILMGDEIKFA